MLLVAIVKKKKERCGKEGGKGESLLVRGRAGRELGRLAKGKEGRGEKGRS